MSEWQLVWNDCVSFGWWYVTKKKKKMCLDADPEFRQVYFHCDNLCCLCYSFPHFWLGILICGCISPLFLIWCHRDILKPLTILCISQAPPPSTPTAPCHVICNHGKVFQSISLFCEMCLVGIVRNAASCQRKIFFFPVFPFDVFSISLLCNFEVNGDAPSESDSSAFTLF